MCIYYDLAKHKLFTISVAGKPERVASPQATKFLKSFDVWS
jgi:hypothetical protein